MTTTGFKGCLVETLLSVYFTKLNFLIAHQAKGGYREAAHVP